MVFKIEFLRTFLRLILIALRGKRLCRRHTFGGMIIIPPSSGVSFLTMIFENPLIARDLIFLIQGSSKQLNLHGAHVQFLLMRLLKDFSGRGQGSKISRFLDVIGRQMSFHLGNQLRQDTYCGSWASIVRNLLDIPIKNVIEGPHNRFPRSMESLVFGLQFNMRLFHPWYHKRNPFMRHQTHHEKWQLPDEEFIAAVEGCILPGNSLKRRRVEA